jgi:hypothetical protein
VKTWKQAKQPEAGQGNTLPARRGRQRTEQGRKKKTRAKSEWSRMSYTMK